MRWKQTLPEYGTKYIVFLSLITLILFFIPVGLSKAIFLVILLFVLCLPLFYVIYKSGDRLLFLIEIIIIAIFGFILILSFRKLRDSLPPPEINQSKVIGYAQYFGYPLYMDAVIFFSIIFFPAAFFAIMRLIDNNKNKKNK